MPGTLRTWKECAPNHSPGCRAWLLVNWKKQRTWMLCRHQVKGQGTLSPARSLWSPLPEPSAYFFRGLSQKKVPLRVSKWKVSFPAAEKRSSQARLAKRNFQSDHLLPALLVHLAPGSRKVRGSGNHVTLETRGQGHRTLAQTLPGYMQPRRPESALRSARLQASPALHPLLPGTPAWKLGTGSERV